MKNEEQKFVGLESIVQCGASDVTFVCCMIVHLLNDGKVLRFAKLVFDLWGFKRVIVPSRIVQRCIGHTDCRLHRLCIGHTDCRLIGQVNTS